MEGSPASKALLLDLFCGFWARTFGCVRKSTDKFLVGRTNLGKSSGKKSSSLKWNGSACFGCQLQLTIMSADTDDAISAKALTADRFTNARATGKIFSSPGRDSEAREVKRRAADAHKTYGRGPKISVKSVRDRKLRANLKILESKYRD